MRAYASIGVFVGIMSFVALAWGDTELKNDSFVSGDTVPVEAGFGSNDIGASRFVAPSAALQLLKVQFIYAGATTQRTVTLKVYDDTAGTVGPGTELFSMDYMVTGADNAMQEITVAGNNVIVPMQFRVGILTQTGGLPNLCRDTDGIDQAKNYIFDPALGWVTSYSLGVRGDWILRAFVSGGAAMPDAGVGGDAGTGAACQGNTDCPAMQFCDLANHHCTFECRTAADCGTGTCNSLGMCVGANNGKGGGCCQTDRGNGAGGVLVGVGVLFLLRRRRR